VLWTRYVQLTQIEAVFRALKTDLGIRRIYHQLEHRVDALLAIIEKRRNLDVSPAGVSSGRNVCSAEARRMG
jgi:hypothetical protein